MKEVLNRILSFRKARDWEQYHTPENLAKSISIEAGELLECYQWDSKNADVEKVKEEECKKLQKALRGRKIALDLRGEQLDSPSFAKMLKESVNRGEEISFVIGGSNGLTREFVAGCDKSISFGKLTFPHQLFRVLLVEQIYRGFMINADSGYHK